VSGKSGVGGDDDDDEDDDDDDDDEDDDDDDDDDAAASPSSPDADAALPSTGVTLPSAVDLPAFADDGLDRGRTGGIALIKNSGSAASIALPLPSRGTKAVCVSRSLFAAAARS
jgi:hypothetical protein